MIESVAITQLSSHQNTLGPLSVHKIYFNSLNNKFTVINGRRTALGHHICLVKLGWSCSGGSENQLDQLENDLAELCTIFVYNPQMIQLHGVLSTRIPTTADVMNSTEPGWHCPDIVLNSMHIHDFPINWIRPFLRPLLYHLHEPLAISHCVLLLTAEVNIHKRKGKSELSYTAQPVFSQNYQE